LVVIKFNIFSLFHGNYVSRLLLDYIVMYSLKSKLQSSLNPGHFTWVYGGKSGILMHFSPSTSSPPTPLVLPHQCTKLLGPITGDMWGEEFWQGGVGGGKCAFQVQYFFS